MTAAFEVDSVVNMMEDTIKMYAVQLRTMEEDDGEREDLGFAYDDDPE